MTRARSLIVATLSSLMLLASLAHGAGRTAQIKAGVHAELVGNRRLPAWVLSRALTPADVTFRSRAVGTTNIVQLETRSVRWSVPALSGGRIKGTATAHTANLGAGAPVTNVVDVKITSIPIAPVLPNP